MTHDLTGGKVNNEASPEPDWTRLLLAYRQDPQQHSSLLIGLLEPAIDGIVLGLGDAPPLVSREDLRQQLILELLEAAQKLPLPRDPHSIKGRLLRHATRAVARWTVRQRRQTPMTLPKVIPTRGREVSSTTLADCFPLHHRHTLGLAIRDIAAVHGITEPGRPAMRPSRPQTTPRGNRQHRTRPADGQLTGN